MSNLEKFVEEQVAKQAASGEAKQSDPDMKKIFDHVKSKLEGKTEPEVAGQQDETQQPDEAIKRAVDQVKPKLEEKFGKLEGLDVVDYKTEGGSDKDYLVKAKVKPAEGDEDIVHLKIQQNFWQAVELRDLVAGKKLEDELPNLASVSSVYHRRAESSPFSVLGDLEKAVAKQSKAEPDSAVKRAVDQVKPKLEEEFGKLDFVEVVDYKTQPVVGTTYLVKAKVKPAEKDENIVHLKIYQNFWQAAELKEHQAGKKLEDELKGLPEEQSESTTE